MHSLKVSQNCKCKVRKCDVCSQCSRCSCDHDGEAVALKISRKRGRHLGYKTVEENGMQSKRHCSSEADVGVSDTVSNESQNTCIAVESNSPVIKTLQDLFYSFGIDKRAHQRKNLSSISLRNNVDNWKSTESGTSTAVGKSVTDLYKALLNRIAIIVCGEEAAELSIQYFLEDQYKFNKKKQISPEDRLVDKLVSSMKKAKMNSSEFRSSRAILCGSFTRNKLNHLLSSRKNSIISHNGFKSGRSDFQKLLSGHPISSPKRTLQRFHPDSVNRCLSFIFSPSNISFLSWGSKLVNIDGVSQSFPLINRKRSKAHIYEDYSTKSDDSLCVQRLSKSSFLRVLTTVTHKGTELRQAVDYVTGFLVNDNFDLVKRMIADLIPSEETRNKQEEEMELARRYLKYGFDESLFNPEETACPIHDTSFGLTKEAVAISSTAQHVLPNCIGCKHLFFFFQNLSSIFSETAADRSVSIALQNCLLKAKLFMGHRVRVVNQQRAIKALYEEMKIHCIEKGFSEIALIIIDFKMKLDPIYWREKTVDHYGKRGMSWHGALIQYYTMVESVPTLSKFYLDQICENDNKQDKFAVISLVEAILLELKRHHPQIRKVIFQSDNAGCYQNSMHLYLFPYLSYIHGIQIDRFVHTETQDGKSLLDAHFARSMQAIYAWCKEGNNCLTPTQAVEALSSYGGLYNTTVELINHDRVRLLEMEKHFSRLETGLKKLVSRTNDVTFYYDEQVNSNPILGLGGCESYQLFPDFSVTVLQYSGQGTGLIIAVDPRIQSCSTEMENLNFTDDASLTGSESQDEVDPIRPSSTELLTEESGTSSSTDTSISVERPNVSITGVATGITIVSNYSMKRRTRKWKTKGRKRRMQHPQKEIQLRNLTNYALRAAIKLQNDGIVNFTSSTTSDLERLSASYPTDYTSSEKFSAGWAIRPKQGAMYGPKNIDAFADEIKQLFDAGEIDKANKKGPAQMLEHLLRTYPRNYLLPTENEIRVEISKLMNQKKKKVSNKSNRTTTSTACNFVPFLESKLAENPSLMPKDALSAVLSTFPRHLNPELPPDEKIKSKFSSMKSQLKKKKA